MNTLYKIKKDQFTLLIEEIDKLYRGTYLKCMELLKESGDKKI